MNRNKQGLSAYDILKIEGCPITLPRARSMTQARIDYETWEPAIFDWYENEYKPTLAEGSPKTETEAPTIPRWLHGLAWIVRAIVVLVTCAVVMVCNCPPEYSIPAVLLLNFLAGYALGPLLTPIEIASETEEAQTTPSPNNEKALL